MLGITVITMDKLGILILSIPKKETRYLHLTFQFLTLQWTEQGMDMECKHGLCYKTGSLFGSTAQEPNLEKDKYEVGGKSQHIKARQRNIWTKLSECFIVK